MFELMLLMGLLVLFGWSAWVDTLSIAAVGLVLYLAGSWLFFDFNHLAFLADPVTFLSLFAFSLAIGTAWSLWNWRLWMHSEGVQRDLRSGKADHVRGGTSEPFRESKYFPETALPSKNFERIITWITLWPFSMIVYFFQDFLMDIGRWIYNRIGQVYIRITDAAIPDDKPTI